MTTTSQKRYRNFCRRTTLTSIVMPHTRELGIACLLPRLSFVQTGDSNAHIIFVTVRKTRLDCGNSPRNSLSTQVTTYSLVSNDLDIDDGQTHCNPTQPNHVRIARKVTRRHICITVLSPQLSRNQGHAAELRAWHLHQYTITCYLVWLGHPNMVEFDRN